MTVILENSMKVPGSNMHMKTPFTQQNISNTSQIKNLFCNVMSTQTFSIYTLYFYIFSALPVHSSTFYCLITPPLSFENFSLKRGGLLSPKVPLCFSPIFFYMFAKYSCVFTISLIIPLPISLISFFLCCMVFI